MAADGWEEIAASIDSWLDEVLEAARTDARCVRIGGPPALDAAGSVELHAQRTAGAARGDLAGGVAAVSASLVPEVADARDHVRGAGGSTLLVFGDYECPYTRAAYRSVQSLEAAGVPFRFAFRHFPLVEIHPHALAAAEASEAAAAQGRFWPMHDLLFRRQKALERGDLERYAGEIGLEVERFQQELEARIHLDRIEGDRSSALASGATGTPTIFVDGLRYRGSYERAELRRALAPNEEETE
jgi:protein-disulfide isomerase